MPIKLKNNATGLLATSISASDTGLVLQAGNGAAFSALGAGEYFYATLASAGGTLEIVRVTARVGDTMTVVRAQEGTSAAGFAAGSRLEQRVTAQSVIDAVGDVVASQVGFTPTGGIAATDVQAALAEVDSEKIAFTRLDDSDGSSLMGFIQAGSGAVIRTAQSKMRDIVSVKDFGAVGNGVADDTVAIHGAIVSGAGAVYLPKGTYKYTGQLTLPNGVNIFGDGMYVTTIDITYAGYAVIIQGIGSEIRDLTAICSQEGVKFQTPQSSVAYTLFNQLTRVKLIGPGRAATYAGRSTHGVLFDFMTLAGSATFFNTVRDCVITQFDDAITFDGDTGSPSTGGNANHALNNQLENYWIAYNIRSIENDIRGGFLHAASGSGSDITVGYRFENGAFNNAVTPATGEPGTLTRLYYAEAGTYNNNIDDGAYNYPTPSIDLGNNNFRRNYQQSLTQGSLIENHYYTVPIAEAMPTNSSAVFTLSYSSNAAALNSASCGTINIYVYRTTGSVTVSFFGKNIATAGTGAIDFEGLFVNGSNVPHLVFYASNNGTATAAGNLNITLLKTSQNVSSYLGGALTDAGTSDPTTDPA
jgi:hypothetical protein